MLRAVSRRGLRVYQVPAVGRQREEGGELVAQRHVFKKLDRIVEAVLGESLEALGRLSYYLLDPLFGNARPFNCRLILVDPLPDL